MGFSMRAIFLFALAVVVLARADDYSDWECPNMPCFIVNYFETRPYDDIKQTCTSISSMTPCNNLMNGVAYDAVGSDGTVLGTHDVPPEGLPCHDVDYLCKETSCTCGWGWTVERHTPATVARPPPPPPPLPFDQSGTQGNLQGCYDACTALNLLDVYQDACTGYWCVGDADPARTRGRARAIHAGLRVFRARTDQPTVPCSPPAAAPPPILNPSRCDRPRKFTSPDPHFPHPQRN